VKELWSRLRDWIEIPSVTGGEADYADALARRLGELGLDVELQEVAAGRSNVLARRARPSVVFCTHLDTVPPFFGSSEDDDFVHGRGSCDAKGPALAMLAAARELLDEGEEDLGFLFTVGEETDSAGARRANQLLAEPWQPRYVIVGEPTENRFVRAHKGAFKGRLVARGVAGHSSQKVGPSAVHELVSSAARLLATDWGRHAHLGPGTLNIGQIQGGVAPNVVADRAEASVLLRAVEDPAQCAAKLERCLSEHVHFESHDANYGPQEFLVPDGEEPIEVAFGTDAPHLSRWGTPLLYGPGRILDAHTDHERVSKASMQRAVADYVRVARELLARSRLELGA
jgi:acetylornithine deacetylase